MNADFKLKRRRARTIAGVLGAGERTSSLMEALSIARRAGEAIAPEVKKVRLAIDFTNPANCRLDPENSERLILFARNATQHSRLRNLEPSLLAAICSHGLPIKSLDIRIRPKSMKEAPAPAPLPQRHGSIAGALRLRAAAQKGDASPTLAELFSRLADALEPAPGRETIDLYASLEALAKMARAGFIASQGLLARLPKAPQEKLIPSEKLAKIDAGVAKVRERMLERLLTRRHFEAPMREAAEGLEREMRRTQMLLDALHALAEAAADPLEEEDAEGEAAAVETPAEAAAGHLNAMDFERFGLPVPSAWQKPQKHTPPESDLSNATIGAQSGKHVKSTHGKASQTPDATGPAPCASPEVLARERLETGLQRLSRDTVEPLEADYLAAEPEVVALVHKIAALGAELDDYDAKRLREARKPIVAPAPPRTPEEVLEELLEALNRILLTAKDARSLAQSVLEGLAGLPQIAPEDAERTKMPLRLFVPTQIAKLAGEARVLREDVSGLVFRLNDEKSRLKKCASSSDPAAFAGAVVAFEGMRARLSDKAHVYEEEAETLADRLTLIEDEAQALQARLEELAQAELAALERAAGNSAATGQPAADAALTPALRLFAEHERLGRLLERLPAPVDEKLIPSEADAEKSPMLAGLRARMLARHARSAELADAAEKLKAEDEALRAAVTSGFNLEGEIIDGFVARVDALEAALAPTSAA